MFVNQKFAAFCMLFAAFKNNPIGGPDQWNERQLQFRYGLSGKVK